MIFYFPLKSYSSMSEKEKKGMEAEALELLKSLLNGELRLEEVMKHLPDPPKLSPFLNRKIDEKLHPLAEKDERFYFIDSLLHTFVEVSDTLAHSAIKTVRYNITRLLEGKKK